MRALTLALALTFVSGTAALAAKPVTPDKRILVTPPAHPAFPALTIKHAIGVSRSAAPVRTAPRLLEQVRAGRMSVVPIRSSRRRPAPRPQFPSALRSLGLQLELEGMRESLRLSQ